MVITKKIGGVEHKECGTCRKWIQLSDFSIKVKNKDGTISYRADCKTCYNEKQKQKYQINKTENVMLCKYEGRTKCGDCNECDKCKICDTCSTRKPLNEFHKNRQYYRNKCKECYNEQTTAYQQQPDVNEHRKLQAKEYHNIPENKARHNQMMRDYMSDPTNKAWFKQYLKWYYEHPENKNKRNITLKQWRALPDVKARISALQKEDRKRNPEKWKIKDAKSHNARRGLGNEWLNAPFIGGDFHHLGTDPYGNNDLDTTVCVPREIHGTGHCAFGLLGNQSGMQPGDGMIEKNTQITQWYEQQYPNDIATIQYLKDVVEATKERVRIGWENAYGWQEWLEYKKNLDKNTKDDTLDKWL